MGYSMVYLTHLDMMCSMNTNAIHLKSCPLKLTHAEVEQFRKDGYLAFGDVLSPSELTEARDAISEAILIGRNRKNSNVGQKAKDKFWVQYEPGFNDETASNEEAELKVRKIMGFKDLLPIFSHLSSNHPKINSILESLIGKDPILFQDMALIKPPFIGSEKPWHQDNAYFSVTPLDAVIGVWIALDDATKENGCMHVIPGGHEMGPLCHHHTFDCEIKPGRVPYEKVVPVEIPAGGAMFFYGLLPHQTPPNSSPDRRRALQFHYRSATSTFVPKETYDTVYAERDGTPASCAANQ